MRFLKKQIVFTLWLCSALRADQSVATQAIRQAILASDLAFLRNALKQDKSLLNKRSLYQELPLETAAFAAQPEVVDFLIAQGADAKNSTTSYGDPILCIVYQHLQNALRAKDQAAVQKYRRIARTFIQAGAMCPDELTSDFFKDEKVLKNLEKESI